MPSLYLSLIDIFKVDWMEVFWWHSSLRQQQKLLSVYDDDHRSIHIKSLTIINNGLNMAHSLYKKKNASNQVWFGATTSKRIEHLNITTMAFSGLKKYKQLSSRGRFWMKKTSFAFKDPESMGIAHFIVRAQDQELWRYLVKLGSSDMLGTYSNLTSDTNFY